MLPAPGTPGVPLVPLVPPWLIATAFGSRVSSWLDTVFPFGVSAFASQS